MLSEYEPAGKVTLKVVVVLTVVQLETVVIEVESMVDTS